LSSPEKFQLPMVQEFTFRDPESSAMELSPEARGEMADGQVIEVFNAPAMRCRGTIMNSG
jgi:hypothetical protein